MPTSTTPAPRQPTTWPPSSTPAAPPGAARARCSRHGNLLSNAQVLKDYWGWQPGDVLIHALPIFHVHGLFVASTARCSTAAG
jgi:malonyl-CoA/methylmalonyl-CoA synthetase